MEDTKSKKEIKKIQEIKEDDQIEDFPEIKPTCPACGSDNCFGMSRVVGYFSIIENWNVSKKAELKRRQKGNYWHERE
jgi:anaerobic ribonucleoside-triphosphate reductase